MNTGHVCAVALSSVLILVSHARAEQNQAPPSNGNGRPGVFVKVEKAIERGARVTASGVEHGVRSAASGVERGAKAATSGIERGTKAVANGVQKGAKATATSASRVANQIGGKSASTPE